jgi:uncharacterized protein YndB with AHSA1/START domain
MTPTSTPPGDQARVSVSVSVAPADAFRIFTEEIDRWWLGGLKFRVAGKQRGVLHLEPRVGGRLFESFDTEAGTRVHETGRVTLWDPPSRLVFDWRAVNFRAGEKTEVEVRFEPTSSGTLVTVTHRGWSLVSADHPVRHGLAVPEFIRMIGMWWGELLSSLRQHAAQSF